MLASRLSRRLKSCQTLYPKFLHRSLSSNAESEKLVITEKLDKTFLIGINRPHKKNCVNTDTAKCLIEAFQEFEADKDAYNAVLYGKGGTFCAGFDLEEVSGLKSDEKDLSLPSINGPMGPSRMLTSKPVIAAIDGYAVAGGFELALLCDLRVIEETAVLGVFCRRFGVPLLDGGTVRLPQLIGLSRALDLILTGRPVSGKEAFEIGLANRLVSCGTALGQAVNLARSMHKFPQECLKADRLSTYYSSFSAKSIEDALNFEFENSKTIITKESIEGAKQFVSGVGRHGSFHLDPDEQLKKISN